MEKLASRARKELFRTQERIFYDDGTYYYLGDDKWFMWQLLEGLVALRTNGDDKHFKTLPFGPEVQHAYQAYIGNIICGD